MLCPCEGEKCTGPDDVNHQCGGPREACAVPGCRECGKPETNIAALVSSLRALAEKATPGPWHYDDNGNGDDRKAGAIRKTLPREAPDEVAYVASWFGKRSAPDGEYLAACSPDVILRLLAALESEYARGVEDAAKVAESEPEPRENPEPDMRQAIESHGAVLVGVSAVRVTKRNIAERIRALTGARP